MKSYKSLFLSVIYVILFSACSSNVENKNNETNESQEQILKEEVKKLQQEISLNTEELSVLEKENVNLKNQLQETENKKQELVAELDNLRLNQSTGHEITEDTARKIVLNHLQEIEDYMVGYQYCVFENDDFFIVEVFSPEPGTDDRSAMLLLQFEVNSETGFFTEVEQDSPGQKKNCVAGQDIFE